MKQQLSLLLLLQLLLRPTDAWVTPLTGNSPLRQMHGTARNAFLTPHDSDSNNHSAMDDPSMQMEKDALDPLQLGSILASTAGLAALAASPMAASAVTTTSTDIAAASSSIVTSGGAIASALFAYGHYFSIIGIVAAIMTERWTLENGPNLTEDEENRMLIADGVYGLIGVLIVYTGYCRLNDPYLGKGAFFYIHEPIFWLKMSMVSVLAAASLFNTTKIIQRSVARFTAGDKAVEPMSEALCDRMKSICNAELTGVLFIPLAATFMSRGIAYNESIPWQAEAGLTALIFLGLGFKYVREALTFESS